MLEGVQYWRDEEEHWVVGGVLVTQTRDGLVTVDRPLGGDSLRLRVSPNNGKVRYERRGVVVTASLGEERHLFLRAGDRRLHYSGQVSSSLYHPKGQTLFFNFFMLKCFIGS